MTNAEISDKFMKAFEDQNWDEWKSYFTDDVAMEDMAAGIKANTLEEFTGYAQGWKTAFPDMKGDITNRIEAGNTLIEEITWRGTQTGDMMSPDGNTIPPTNKTVALRTCFIMDFENGKCKSFKNYNDIMTMMGQLGLMPS